MEHLWNCPACGCRGIAASLPWCPNCGIGRSGDVGVAVHQTSGDPAVDAEKKDDGEFDPFDTDWSQPPPEALAPPKRKGRM